MITKFIKQNLILKVTGHQYVNFSKAIWYEKWIGGFRPRFGNGGGRVGKALWVKSLSNFGHYS